MSRPTPTLEQRLDAAIERTQATIEANAEILAMHQCLDELQAGHRQPQVQLTEADLDDIDNERVGEEYCTRPWEW